MKEISNEFGLLYESIVGHLMKWNFFNYQIARSDGYKLTVIRSAKNKEILEEFVNLEKVLDYVVSYKNNSGIGTGTVMLTGKGNYTGTTYREFGIVKAHGFFKIDGHTHYFDINGREARNCWAQGYQFDSSGAMTADSEAFKAKIDKYAADMLAKYGYDSNTPYSKLKTLFYHFEKSGYNFQEQSFPHFSSPKWEMDAANYLLTYRRGNCHRYSALMANLARAVGYDAVAQYHYYIKIISGIRNWTHAWTEVIDDQGVAYVCDAEIRIEIVRQRGYGTAAFMEKKSTIGNYGPGYLTYYYAWGITEGGGKEYSFSRAAKSDDRSNKTPRIDLGNNPMVSATVACAVAVEVAMKG